MSDLIKVADEVKLLAKKFRGILSLAEAVENIGKLDQAVKEAEGLKGLAMAELEKVKEVIESKKKDLEAAEVAVQYAEAKAQKIVEAAHVKGNSLVDEAVAESKLLLVDVEKKKKLFDEQFIAAGKELASVEADIALKKQELEAIKKEAEAVKQKFSALLK